MAIFEETKSNLPFENNSSPNSSGSDNEYLSMNESQLTDYNDITYQEKFNSVQSFNYNFIGT